jgi:hypothetical protein
VLAVGAVPVDRDAEQAFVGIDFDHRGANVDEVVDSESKDSHPAPVPVLRRNIRRKIDSRGRPAAPRHPAGCARVFLERERQPGRAISPVRGHATMRSSAPAGMSCSTVSAPTGRPLWALSPARSATEVLQEL